ncbi:hypothetical protein ACHWQZ_G003281 [Mnemiopsis leidyi]
MSDKITVEDFTSDQACGTPPPKKKPPHHIPHHMSPSSLARIPNFDPESVPPEQKLEGGNSVVIEDFVMAQTLPSPCLSQHFMNSTLKFREDSAEVLEKTSDEKFNFSMPDNHDENQVSIEPIQPLIPTISETKIIHNDLVLSKGVNCEEGQFNIARNFSHVLSLTRHCQSDDCEIVDKTYKMDIFYKDLDNDDEGKCKFIDNSRDPSLVNEKNLFTIGDDFMLTDTKSSFNMSPDLNICTGSNSFHLDLELNHDKESRKFSLHDGLNWRASKSIKVIGKIDCSFDAKRPGFFIPEVKSTCLRNRSDFKIPLYDTPPGIKKAPKFSIPDYDDKNDKSKHSKFRLYHDIKVFKDRCRHSIPKNFSTGWGIKRFSVPTVRNGARKTHAKVLISEEVNYSPTTNEFKIPPQSNHNQSEELNSILKGSKFYISEVGNLFNETKNVNIAPEFDLRLEPGKVKDLTQHYELINETRNFKLSHDFVLNNVNLSHEFNELLIDCSEISL